MRRPKPVPMPEARYYCVVDLEATCDNADPPAVPRDEMETIEIGAVMIDGQNLEVVGEFQSFVRPVRHPELTPFCRELTGITQDKVDKAPGFQEVFGDFLTWCAGYHGWAFSSWGAFDATQIHKDCAFHGLPLPVEIRRGLNLKVIYAKQRRIKRCGIPAALSIEGLGEFSGQHHRAIDDARNIVRLLPAMFFRGEIK